MNIDTKMLNTFLLQNPNTFCCKPGNTEKDHTPQPSWIIPGSDRWFSIHKSISVIQHINKRKDEKHMIISINEEKAFDKIQHPFMIASHQKSIEGNIYDKPTAR